MSPGPAFEKFNDPRPLPACEAYPGKRCSASDFQQEYLGIFAQESARDRWLINLAKEYHERTEAYDRAICTGPIMRGVIMPGTPRQHRAIQRNAIAVSQELLAKARNFGVTGAEWQNALRVALREIERQNTTHLGTTHKTEGENHGQ